MQNNNENRDMSQSGNFEFPSLLKEGKQEHSIKHAPNEIDDASHASKVAELISKSKEDFLKEYEKHDENKRKEIYCLVLHEVHEAFLSNEVKHLQKLGDLIELINGLEETKKLKFYFDNIENQFRKSNAIILALINAKCQYGAMINAKDEKGRNLLHYASDGGCKEVVEILISEGAEINAKDVDCRTPLHISAFNGHMDVLEILLRKGALIDSKDKYGSTPLHLAAKKKDNEKVVEYLMSKGANINAKDYREWTPMHLASLCGNTTVIKLLYEAGADENFKGISQETPLHLAVRGNYIEAVEYLSSIKDINLNCNNCFGDTPLFYAIFYNSIESFHILISKGANVNARKYLKDAVITGDKGIVDVLLQHESSATITCKEYTRLLKTASERGKASVLETLLKKVNHIDVPVNKINKIIEYAIHRGEAKVIEIFLEYAATVNLDFDWEEWLQIAAERGHKSIVEMLLRYGAYENKAESYITNSLQLAVKYNHINVVETLLHYKEANIHFKDEKGRNLLHTAAYYGQLEMVIWLFNKGVDSTSKDKKGNKPIHSALLAGHVEIVEIFLNNGSDINERGAVGMTHLHYAAISPCTDLNSPIKNPTSNVTLKDNVNLLTYLLRKGIAYNATDDKNREPLHMINPSTDAYKFLVSIKKLFIAVKENNPSEVENCIKEGAFIDAKSVNNLMVLHHAAWKGYENIVSILLKNKANPNVIGKNLCTPMHYAAKFGHFGIVKALLLNGATYNVASITCKTPLDFAEDEDIINLLKLVDDAFKDVQNGNSNVIEDLKQVNDVEEVKAVLNCCNQDGISLVAHAIRNNFPEIEKLKELLVEGLSEQFPLNGSVIQRILRNH